MIKINKNVCKLAGVSNLNPTVLLCSSGVDSVAMTHFILDQRRKMFGDITVLHFNHKIRPENDIMQRSFETFMHECFPQHPHVVVCNTDKNLKTEDSLRQFRINWLQYFPGVIITAHHLNDFVESYLLNTIRGNPEYLPMPFVSKHAHYTSCKPFCFTRKQDFIEYAQQHDLMKYVVEDSSNKITQGSRRNLIRNEIIPILDREHVGLEKIVSRRMQQRLADESTCVSA